MGSPDLAWWIMHSLLAVTFITSDYKIAASGHCREVSPSHSLVEAKSGKETRDFWIALKFGTRQKTLTTMGKQRGKTVFCSRHCSIHCFIMKWLRHKNVLKPHHSSIFHKQWETFTNKTNTNMWTTSSYSRVGRALRRPWSNNVNNFSFHISMCRPPSWRRCQFTSSIVLWIAGG